MNKSGPIIIIEDDPDDMFLIQFVYRKLCYNNDLIFLEDGEVAMKYLSEMKTVPFLIISDINIPKINGLELRDRVKQNEAVNLKCIPYVILSTFASKELIDTAYSLGIQGYFKKPADPVELKEMFQTILEYWKQSYAPGMFM